MLPATQLFFNLAYVKFSFFFKTNFKVFIDVLSSQNILGTRDSDAHLLEESLPRKKRSLVEFGKVSDTNCLMVFIVLTKIKSYHFNRQNLTL